MACISLINNFYSYYTKNFHFELIIADSKENINKYIYYIIVTIITLIFILSKILKILDKITLKKIKIYKI